jgi:hypothetical protein
MCFGAADSEQVHAAKIGVLVLLGFIVPILAAIAFIARTWARRARELDKLTFLNRCAIKVATFPP